MPNRMCPFTLDASIGVNKDIVSDNHVSGSAFLQYAQLLLEIAVGNLCIALKGIWGTSPQAALASQR